MNVFLRLFREMQAEYRKTSFDFFGLLDRSARLRRSDRVGQTALPAKTKKLPLTGVFCF